ncbi:MAG: hypothetical protein KBT46_05435 [Ruminococcus sp.]|nr:hypothetical protein [Candidatus Copronaster equi]
MEKILKIIFLIAFVIVAVAFAFFTINEKLKTDDTYPVITAENDMLMLSVNSSQKDMLKGITAYDEKDGDLTDKVIVETVSKFIQPGICEVTYAVCDSDKHVSSLTSKIKYIDYTKPKFSMNRSLCYSVNEKIKISSVFTAKDVIDGDVTREIKITSDDYKSGSQGEYRINVKLTNSKDDTVSMDLPLFVEQIDQNAPKITLKRYLIYVDKGTKINPEDYIKSAKDTNGKDLIKSVEIESGLNTSENGVYTVHYYLKDSQSRKTHTMLTVVVGEQ